MAEITIARMIQCAERELTMRRSGYPHMVRKERITQEFADEEIAAMKSICEVLRLLASQGVA